MNAEDIVVPTVFFTFLGIVIVMAILAKHRERMLIVEKGLAPDEIKALYTRNLQFGPLSSLKWGMIFVFVGLAILIGTHLHIDDASIAGMINLAAGVALVLFYIMAPKPPAQPK